MIYDLMGAFEFVCHIGFLLKPAKSRYNLFFVRLIFGNGQIYFNFFNIFISNFYIAYSN